MFVSLKEIIRLILQQLFKVIIFLTAENLTTMAFTILKTSCNNHTITLCHGDLATKVNLTSDNHFADKAHLPK